MIEIRIEPINAEIVKRALSRIPGAIEKASKTAIKASLRAGKKQAKLSVANTK